MYVKIRDHDWTAEKLLIKTIDIHFDKVEIQIKPQKSPQTGHKRAAYVDFSKCS